MKCMQIPKYFQTSSLPLPQKEYNIFIGVTTMNGKYEKIKKNGNRSKRILNLLLIVIFFILIATIAVVWIYYNYALGRINHVNVPDIVYSTQSTEPETNISDTVPSNLASETTATVPENHIPSSADYINFLLVGQAAREGETERFADTMILCTVNTYEKTLTMTSLFRDTLIKMPNYRGHTGGNIKLTTIYHLGSIYGDGIAGSMELMNLTLFENFGIEVDHNFEVDFDAFIQVVDMLGGIDIELTEAEAEYLNAEDFWVYQDVQPGMAHLDGMTALCYARMRKASGDSGSDIVRTSRQRKVILTIIEKLKKLSISEIQSIVDEVLPMIITSMDNQEITEMAIKLLPILPELRINSNGTCPATYWGEMVDIYSDGMYHSVLRFDPYETKRTMREITEGEFAE